ncbi:MAG: hypothetical protein MUE60_00800 [Candidatus Eisenbacteria bacterium]|jgi:4-amino-4-deoxy-L-arabinose transferase-like glycosyltransferase|nr:hypothetical protein [Candidatus Eisenbacteria bacterium]
MAVYAAIVLAHRDVLCPYTPDSLWYTDVARFLARGDGLRCNITLASDPTPVPRPFYGWPPLYPVAGALFVRLGADPLFAMRMVSIAAFVALPIPLLALGTRLWGRLPAVAATLWVPLWPTMFSLSGQALSESLFLVLLAWTLAMVARDEQGAPHPARAGLLLGAAGLTRLAGALFVPALAVSLVRRRTGFRTRDAVIAVGMFMGTAGLWVARNSLATGAPSGFEEPAQAVRLAPIITACIQRVFWEMTSIGSLGLVVANQWKLAVPALAALTVVLRFHTTPGNRILLLWAAMYLVGISWLRTQGPFDSPSGGRTLAPTLMIVAFWLAGNLGAAALRSRRRVERILSGALLVMLLCGLLYGRLRDLMEVRSRAAPACQLVQCAMPGLALLEEMAGAGEAVLSNVAFKTAWCQDRPSVQLPIRPYSNLVLNPRVVRSLARFHGARFMYLEETSVRGTHGHDPLVFSLLRGDSVPGLRPVLVDRTGALFELTEPLG